MNKYYINIRDGEVDREVHIKLKEEDMKLLSLILAESRLVIGFWQE